jgi:predicted RNA binding protein YcfA (HicA-like mRNA interferase family)
VDRREGANLMRPIKTLEQIIAGSNAIRFVDMIALTEAFGFELDRVNKGHHIFTHPLADRVISLQSVRHTVKSYQGAQFLRFVQEYELKIADDL